MSAQEPQTVNSILWHREPEQTGMRPDAVLHGWLKESGLLTVRLRQLCDEGFRLEVLDANSNATQSAETGIHRTVMLHCGDNPCIYAETTIPAATAIRHPWLKELGDEPLGERLQSQPDVQRSEFRFALLSAGNLPDDLTIDMADNSTSPLWARQSDFQLGNTSLTVTEVFLPGIVDYTKPHIHSAD
jgi:chorismate--pyruvate lyase